MAIKYNTYIAVFFQEHETGRNIVKFVTGVEKSSALWEDDKPAMKLGDSFARDIVLGLTFNGYAAAVVKFMNGVEVGNGKWTGK
jgi:hypothetical protein